MEGEDSDPPDEWIISRICEEFNCLPSEALGELMDEPRGMALDIMELRAYARAKDALDNAEKKEDVADDPMVAKVWEVLHELRGRKEDT